MNVLFGIQYQAADFFIVPPGSDPFSRITELDPCRAAFRAAGTPAAPAPTTTTSYVSSHETCPASTTLWLRLTSRTSVGVPAVGRRAAGPRAHCPYRFFSTTLTSSGLIRSGTVQPS